MKNVEPLITIVVSIYNGEKYLSECIDSISQQDYSNLEIILINDGSNDNSGIIADRHAQKDNRIKVIHQENLGVSISRNRAIDMSHGKYLCIIDQDDCISKDYVSYFYGLIEEYKVDIALTPSVDIYFGFPHEDTKRQIDSDRVDVWSGEQTTIEMLYHKIIIAPWNKMISMELINNNKLRFNPNYYCGEGFAFSLECYQRANKIAIGHRKIYHYRVGDPETGASKFRLSTIYSSINAQKYIKDTFVVTTPALLKAWNFSNWHTHCDCLNIMVGCNVAKQYNALYHEIATICRKDAFCALSAPVSAQQKLRGILFKVWPYFAAQFINYFRIRKFKKIDL